MWHKTKFTELLKIKYPIVQGPFGGGLSSVKLTSTISNLGGMGSFGAQPLNAAQILETNHAIRQQTDKPYAINLWVNDRDSKLKSYSQEDYDKLVELFKPYFDELNIAPPKMPFDLGPAYEEQVEALLEAKPPVFSFVFGVPSEKVLEACGRVNFSDVSYGTLVLNKCYRNKVVADQTLFSNLASPGIARRLMAVWEENNILSVQSCSRSQ